MIYGSTHSATACSHCLCLSHTHECCVAVRIAHMMTIPQGMEYMMMYCYRLLELWLAVLTRAIWLQHNVASVGRWMASGEGIPWT